MSDHFDGKRFFNPHVSTDRSVADLLRWRRSRRPVPWPRYWQDEAPFTPVPVSGNDIAATYIGQATFLLQFSGLNVLTDPMFSLRASPVAWLGPKRVRDPAIALVDLPPIHLVLLSHNHYDHMDLPSLRSLCDRWRPLVVTGLGNGAYLAGKGLAGAIELDWWQSCNPRPDVRVTFVPAQHWSKRGLFDRRTMLWGGHMLETPAGRVYFAGDTGYPAHFHDIRRRLGEPDLALLPIGAYEPRWFMGPQHMNPDEAVQAHRDLGAHLSLAMHFATFPLADEAIDAPVLALAKARDRHGVPADRFQVPAFGTPVVC
ncbi:MBL fold metallo-hydrolase [Telmatospirillum sp.]|uniref:MBL fold metallo-hydrolase n=1 Tax=Telmatospirillum sp. TaxID=2079197 RepID=UPI00283E7933|nr:MBL fold metallo-hydrolase [Telmatospirillum sp.]MDR3438250.1 MBL fold metallo-hydrolase [Telmatospirillum sp.]